MSIDPNAFARNWVAAWNRRDAEAVLAHYAEQASFVSPKAATLFGRAELRNKDELRQYWLAALQAIEHLVFTLDRISWDPLNRTLTILYVASLNGVSARATEIVEFNADGLIQRGEALYGAVLVEDMSSVDA
jgi:hypothetical protein